MARQNSDRAGGRLRTRWHRLYDTVLTTIVDLEGTTLERNNPGIIQLQPPSGKMNVDFSNWGTNSTQTGSNKTEPDSTHTHSSTEAESV
jgi:hypothetical protein